MLETYFAEFEAAIRDFPYTISYSLQKKFYSNSQGFIKGKALLQDESVLEFVEVKDADSAGKLKYRYHYRRKDDNFVFRYDNAPHHPGLPTFPNHKHDAGEHNIIACEEPELLDVLLEIKLLLGESR